MRYIDYHPINGSLIVHGNCEVCKERIEKIALSVEGVFGADWCVADGKLHLSFDPLLTSLNEISMNIVQAGHGTNIHKASKDCLDRMEDCCKPTR